MARRNYLNKAGGVIFAVFLFLFLLTTPTQAETSKINENIINFANLKELINEKRVINKSGNLSFHKELIEIAEARLEDMQKNNYFAHKNSQGYGVKELTSSSSYQYLFVGENLARNYFHDNELLEAWMESPDHKKNLLKKEYHDLGLAQGYIKLNNNYNFVVVLILGKGQ